MAPSATSGKVTLCRAYARPPPSQAVRSGGLYSLLPGLAVGRDAAVALAFAVHACRELRLSRTCQPITASPGTAQSPWRRRHTHTPLARCAPGHTSRAVIDRRRPGQAALSSSPLAPSPHQPPAPPALPSPAQGGIRNGSRRILNNWLFRAFAAPPSAAARDRDCRGEKETADWTPQPDRATQGHRSAFEPRHAAPRRPPCPLPGSPSLR